MFAGTDDLVGRVVGVTGVAIKVIRAGVSRAGAGPTVLPRTQHRISKEPVHTPGIYETSVGQARRGQTEKKVQPVGPVPLAEVSRRAVPAVRTLSGAGVTEVGVAVTLAGAAAGEAPLARLAVGALASHGSGPALALARHWVTLVAQRALWVTVTGWEGGGT